MLVYCLARCGGTLVRCEDTVWSGVKFVSGQVWGYCLVRCGVLSGQVWGYCLVRCGGTLVR